MFYSVYEWLIWPLGTFLLGFVDYNIFWSVVAATPVITITFTRDRERQKLSKTPYSAINTAVMV
ncbi:hypothetical protein N9K16_06670, partial [Alphaproteobacteria bacterium]|nr:hypothetical protein [Alphaproteobacteria bacterium]